MAKGKKDEDKKPQEQKKATKQSRYQSRTSAPVAKQFAGTNLANGTHDYKNPNEQLHAYGELASKARSKRHVERQANRAAHSAQRWMVKREQRQAIQRAAAAHVKAEPAAAPVMEVPVVVPALPVKARPSRKAKLVTKATTKAKVANAKVAKKGPVRKVTAKEKTTKSAVAKSKKS